MTMQEHRIELKQLSELANNIAGSIQSGTEFSGNKALADYYSDGDESVLFRSFSEWVNLGYRVKKGEKAFAFWGTPQEFEIRSKEKPELIESVGTYCPVVFKFSENQVYKPENLK